MEIIDGHVHLMEPVGHRDTVFQETTGKFGRLLEADGSFFQYLPPYMKDSCFDAETLIATIDHYGVSKAILMAHLGTGINEMNLAAQAAYPDRIYAACSVDPYDDQAADQIQKLRKKGCRILKFEMRSMNELFGETLLSSESMQAVIDAAAGNGMTIAIDPGPCRFSFYHPEEFRATAAAYPDTHFVMCHMGLPYYGIEKSAGDLERWKQMTCALALPNVWTDTSAIPDLFCEEEYPYPSAMECFRYLVQRYGSGKMIWGTDIPGTLKNATYPQMMRLFERCSALTEENKAALFAENAREAYRI